MNEEYANATCEQLLQWEIEGMNKAYDEYLANKETVFECAKIKGYEIQGLHNIY